MTNFIPEHNECFIPWGIYKDVLRLVSADIFFPFYIQGLSGDGKTLFVKEAAYQHQKSMIRCNITSETDESDLIGTYQLIKGETVWVDGPVLTAMKTGSLLLLDEVDLATPKIMCLQPVLEGESIYIKKTGEIVKPAPGFNVCATGNTKGKGSETGHFVGTGAMNEAFLDRIPVMFYQPYPDAETETKILGKYSAKFYNSLAKNDDPLEADKILNETSEAISNLVNWATAIRTVFDQGGIDEVISTRRLRDIMLAYFLFKDYKKAILSCIERFDTETKLSMLNFYSKVTGVELT